MVVAPVVAVGLGALVLGVWVGLMLRVVMPAFGVVLLAVYLGVLRVMSRVEAGVGIEYGDDV